MTIAWNPIVPSDKQEEAAIQELVNEILAGGSQGCVAYLVGPKGEMLALPESLHSVLKQAAEALARGHSVSVIVADQELSTQQTAEMLNVSRPYLIKLLEAGAMPYRKVGTHRRIEMDDVLKYRARESARRLEPIGQMAREADEQGEYEA